jgi:hypothetical protein
MSSAGREMPPIAGWETLAKRRSAPPVRVPGRVTERAFCRRTRAGQAPDWAVCTHLRFGGDVDGRPSGPGNRRSGRVPFDR